MEILKTLKKSQLSSILELHPKFKKVPKSWSKEMIIQKMIEYDVHYKVPIIDKYESYTTAFLKKKCREIDPTYNCNVKTKMVDFLKNKNKEKESNVIEKLYQCVTETNEIDISMNDMVEML